jgi:hypothetical protein
MKITLKQWLELEAKVKAIGTAVSDLEMYLLDMLWKHQNNATEAIFIKDFLERLDSIPFLPDCHPQSEWTGGDSSDPKNYKLREPHAAGTLGRRYFTNEEMADARNLIALRWHLGIGTKY